MYCLSSCSERRITTLGTATHGEKNPLNDRKISDSVYLEEKY